MSKQAFLTTAHRIGRQLCRDALWSGPACNWLGWSVRTVGPQMLLGRGAQNATLGYGTAGIALFLARLYAFTQDPLVKSTAHGAIQHALKSVGSDDVSYFTGSIGIACAASETGELLQAEDIKNHSSSLFARATEHLAQGNGFSSMAAIAGVAPLLTLQRRFHAKNAFEYAVHLGGKLNKSIAALVGNNGNATAETALGVNALLALASDTGDERFKLAAGHLLEQVKNHAPVPIHWPGDPAANFPDLYQEVALPIAFLRAQMFSLPECGPDQQTLLKELDTVLQSATASLVRPLVAGDGGYSLAHGVAGKAELLMLAAQKLTRPELLQMAWSAAETGVSHFGEQKLPWPCAMPVAGESPNLLFGLAGIGYLYLRLCDSAAVPSLFVSVGS